MEAEEEREVKAEREYRQSRGRGEGIEGGRG